MNDLADTVKHLTPKHLSIDVPDVLRHLPGTVQHQVAHLADQIGDHLPSISMPSISMPSIPGRKRKRSKTPFVIAAVVVAAGAAAVMARRRSARSMEDVESGFAAAKERSVAAA